MNEREEPEERGAADGPSTPPVDREPDSSAPTCDLCGAPMRESHCKLICDRCGYTRDCSDP